MAGSFVQQTGFSQTQSGTLVNVPVTNLPSAGNTLFALVRVGSAFTLSSVTDPQGNSWFIDKDAGSGSNNAVLARGLITTPYISTDNIGFNMSTTGGQPMIELFEYTGILLLSSALDVSASLVSTAVKTITIGPTSATSQNHELVIAGITTSTSGLTGWTHPSGYTTRTITSPRSYLEDLTDQPSGSTPSATWSWTSTTSNASAIIATYKAIPAATTGSAFFALF